MLSSDKTRASIRALPAAQQLTLWKAVFDSLPDGIAVFDLAGEGLYVNSAGMRILGLGESDGLSARLEDISNNMRFCSVDGVELSSEQRPIARVVRGENIVDQEIRATNLVTGVERIHSCSGNLVPDETGRPAWALLRFRDITARRKDEALRERLLGELEAVIAAIPEGVVIHGPGGEITRINPAAAEILEYTSEQLAEPVKKRLANITALDAHDRPIPFEQMPSPRALRGEIVEDMALRWPSADGYVELSANGAPMVDKYGRLLGAVMTMRDVTNSRRAERERVLLLQRLHTALETSEQTRSEWKALFESISDGIIVGEDGFKNVEANASALKIMGVSTPCELERLYRETPQWCTLYTEDGLVILEHERPWQRAIQGEDVVDFACRYVNRLGKSYDLTISANRVSTVPGGKQRYLQVLSDVTELRKLEKAKDEFLLIVSHELRNPLQVVKGLTQLFKLKLAALGVQDKIERHLEMMDSQVGQITSLVDDILTAYRLRTGRFSTDLKPVDLLAVVADAAAPIMVNAPDHPITVDLPQVGPVMVYGDTQRLTEILANLLSNAIKYSPQGGRVGISAQRCADSISVFVEDEGIGIPPEHLEKVFDGFHRVGQVSEWKSGGIGLGLYISRRLARLHGGDLWAENRPGGGTRMCLRLPQHKPPPGN